MSALAMRHDLLAIGVVDPREFDVPPIGLVTFCDPSTGTTREVMVTDDVQRKFADLAGTERVATRTDRPCIGRRLAGAVDRRRLAGRDRRTRAPAPAASGDGPPMSWDFLAPYRLWLLLVVAGLVVAYVFAQRRRVPQHDAFHTDRDARPDRPQATQLATSRRGRRAARGIDGRRVRGRPAGRTFDDTSQSSGQDHPAVRRFAVDAGRRCRSESAGSRQAGRSRLRRRCRPRRRSRADLVQRNDRHRRRPDH